MKKLLILLLSVLVVFSSCSTTERVALVPSIAAVQEVSEDGLLTGTIIEVSRYGNTYLDLMSSDFLDEFALGDIVAIEVGGNSIYAPVVTSYSDVDNGNPLVKVNGEYVEVALSYADFATTYSVGIGSQMCITLAEEAGYLTEFEIRHLERTDNRSDYASDEVFANFRALKGGNLKENLIYRSCNPALDDIRAPYADELAEAAGIKKVINLADTEETIRETINQYSYYAELYSSGSVILLGMGVDFRTDDFKAKLKEGIEFILSAPDAPVLVHCNEGKDRAGMVSALLEALAGATMDEIIEDYMKSYENYYGVEKGSEKYDAISQIIVDFFLEINGRAFPESGLKNVAEVYLTAQVGLTDEQVQILEALITN